MPSVGWHLLHIEVIVTLGALTLGQCVHLLLVHVLRGVVADNAQNSGQIHELERLSRPIVHNPPPVFQPFALAEILPVEDVVLFLDRVDFAHSLKLLQQVQEDLLVEQEAHIQMICGLAANMEFLTTLQRSKVYWERVINEDGLNCRVLTHNTFDIEEVFLSFFLVLLWLFLVVLVTLGIFFLLLVRLRVGQVEVNFVFWDLARFAENEASDALIHVEVLSKILCYVPLKHKLVVLLPKVLYHLLVVATVDLWQLRHLFFF